MKTSFLRASEGPKNTKQKKKVVMLYALGKNI
jgi:hypothetical protein